MMASFDETFLADLDNLDVVVDNADFDGCINHNDEDADDDLSMLHRSQQRYTDILRTLQKLQEPGSDHASEYQLIAECNALSVEIENEIVILHNFIRDKYRFRFPELESIVHHPIDYARVVKNIGNQTDPSLFRLQGLLPSSIIIVVSLTSSTTSGKPLPNEELNKTIDACDLAIALDSLKNKLVDFMESRMTYIAPNFSAVVGSVVAAKLIVTAGGLSSLANMPACNVQLLGAKQINTVGFSNATSRFHDCYLEETEIMQATPPPLRMRAYRLLAAKSTLAARVDLIHGDPSGKVGTTLKDEIITKIDKWQEPPPAKRPKSLPVPDAEPKKKKRGGRRLRKMKEKNAMVERKLAKANRMQFGVAEESCLDAISTIWRLSVFCRELWITNYQCLLSSPLLD